MNDYTNAMLANAGVPEETMSNNDLLKQIEDFKS